MLKFSAELRKASSNVYFDYSAVQAICSWITDATAESTATFTPLLDAVKSLKEIISLTSGLALVEIWSSFLKYSPLPATPAIKQLEVASCSLRGIPSFQGTLCTPDNLSVN